MKLKVGDKVRILEGRDKRDPENVGWVRDIMCEMVGLETMITREFFRGAFKLNIDQGRYSWANYWLEKIK